MAGWGTCRDCRRTVWWGTSRIDPHRVWPFDDLAETSVHFDTCRATEHIVDSQGTSHRVVKCRLCGARVWWQTTPGGRRRPMDCDGSSCHFDTCTKAGAHRPQPQANDPLHMWLADLGLAPPATLAEATSAFRRLVKQTHPDLGGSDAAFIRVKLAYDRVRQLLAQEVSA